MSFDRTALTNDLSVVVVGQMIATIQFQTLQAFERRRSDADDEWIEIGLVERSYGVGIEIQDADLALHSNDLSDVVDGRAVEIAIVQIGRAHV